MHNRHQYYFAPKVLSTLRVARWACWFIMKAVFQRPARTRTKKETYQHTAPVCSYAPLPVPVPTKRWNTAVHLKLMKWSRFESVDAAKTIWTSIISSVSMQNSLVHRARQAMRHHTWWWGKLGIILQTSIQVVHNVRVRQDFAEHMVWATFLKQRLCQTNKGHGVQRDHTATVLRAIPWKWVHQPATNFSTRTCTNETSMPS